MSKIDHHSWHKYKSLPWVVCRFCGLVALKNDFTELCIKLGCNYQDAPAYKNFWKK